jgi:hypothetical protein
LSKKFLTPVGLPSGNTLPSVGSAGDLFYKTDEGNVYVHSGADWSRAGVDPEILAAKADILEDGYVNPGQLNEIDRFQGLRKFVGLSFSGNSAITSVDGITWTETSTSMTDRVFILYGNRKFVAIPDDWIASEGSNSVYVSNNGTTWENSGSLQTLPFQVRWRGAAYGGGKFVVVASPSSIAAYSSDGITWTQTSMPSSQRWGAVAYGGGKFVAIAGRDNPDSAVAAYSLDGITWTQTSMPSSSRWQSVTYGNGKFVAIAYGTTAAYSEDGITWTESSPLHSSASFIAWSSVTYGDGKFVAVAPNAAIFSVYSTDGITWTQSVYPKFSAWNQVSYGAGKFVALSSDRGDAAYSFNAINWTVTSIPSDYYLALVYGEDFPKSNIASEDYVDLQISNIGSTLSDLTDTTITSPVGGQTLLYDEGTSRWINVSFIDILSGLGLYTGDGGSYNTTEFTGTMDGGSYNTTLFASVVDGGNEGSF